MLTSEKLNEAVTGIRCWPRVRFETGLGESAVNWIEKKHANGMVHEPGTIAAFLALARERGRAYRNIFDIGALYGYFSLVAAMMFSNPKITAFEMHPGVFGALLQNVPMGTDCILATVSDECRENETIWISGFNIFEKPEGGWENLETIPGAMKPRGKNNRGRGFAETSFITLDSYCEDHTPPDLMKIDVEGYQAKAIRGGLGMIARHRPDIIIELHDPEKLARFGTSNKETVQPLFELGYRGFWCGNFRDREAVYHEVDEMTDAHERLSIMVFVP